MTTRRLRTLLATIAAAALMIPAAPAVLAQPANDDIGSATAIAALPFTDSLDTSDATTAGDDPDCAGNGHTVWYTLTPGADMTIAADTFGSDYDTTLSAYTGTPGSLEQIACNDDSGSLQSRIVVGVTSGVTYFIMVGSFFDSPGGALELRVSELLPPPNDDFDVATVVATPLPFTDEIDTDLATSASDDPDCNGNAFSVWYVFTADANAEIEANTFGSGYETTVSAWTGTRGDLTQVGCGGSRVRFQAVAGETYYFMVGSAFEEAGHLVFTVRELPPPLVLGLSINATGTVNRAGVATFGGSLTCSREAADVTIIGTVRQQQGKKAAVASFIRTVSCTTPVAWTASVAGETAPFRRGDAAVVASINFFDEGRDEVVSARASRTVRLQ